MNEKRTNEIKRIIRKILMITLIGIMIIYVVVLGKPVWEMLNLNVKAINVSSENDNNSFYYQGNRYQKIDEWSLHNLTFSTQKDECLGRIKGTFIVLYTLKNDPDHSILIGDAPNSLVVYSKEHSEIPSEGEITGVFLHAAMPEPGKNYSKPVFDVYMEDKNTLEMFKKFWEEKNILPVKEFGEIDSYYVPHISVMFCYENCKVPYQQYTVAYFDEQWYYLKAEYNYYDNRSHTSYDGYRLTDEMQDYFDQKFFD